MQYDCEYVIILLELNLTFDPVIYAKVDCHLSLSLSKL